MLQQYISRPFDSSPSASLGVVAQGALSIVEGRKPFYLLRREAEKRA